MLRRNWLDLSRKLVDRYDMDFTVNAMQAALGEAALSYWGEGVLITTTYPNPFPITMSGIALGGSVGNGIGYDPNGLVARIDTGSTHSKNFTIPTADPSQDRWDLLVIRHLQVGDTPVPKPEDPIQTVFLNFHDEFELAVVPGTPSGSPAYPAKGSQDIILAGLRVPAGTLAGTGVTVDLSIREMATEALAQYPDFIDEVLTGTVDGSNKNFSMSQTPLGAPVILLDGVRPKLAEYTITGAVVTFVTAPALGQDIEAFYLAAVPNNSQPLSMIDEVPGGIVDGTNDTFTLSGKPSGLASTWVTVDGIKAKIGTWDLIQGTIYKVKFEAGSIPAAGQDVEVSYVVNTKTIGMAPAPGPGSGGGQYAVQGSAGSPLVVDPTAGIMVNSDPRMLKIIASNGGAAAISSTPQIQNGQFIGQELTIKGTSDINYVTIQDGNGLSLNGSYNLKSGAAIYLVWDGSVWEEISRR